MDQNQKSLWENAQKKGKLRFVLFYGALLWGLPTGILFSIVMRAANPPFVFSDYFTMAFLMDLISKCLTFGLFGLLYGLYLWRYIEKKKASK